jgi:ABC-type Zn2+ transport system substrate-binding protein/surface adhesin
LVVLQGNVRVFGKNVDKTKMEVKDEMENFMNKAFQKFHIAIWSYMKLEDVLEVFPMLMLKSFLYWFIFI